MTKEFFDNENSSLEGYGKDNIYNGERVRQKQQVKNNSTRIENQQKKDKIKNLKTENPNLSFEVWSNTLKDKRQKLEDKVNEYFPETSLELDFILSIKTILNIEDIISPISSNELFSLSIISFVIFINRTFTILYHYCYSMDN